jgi:hypothetical protein
MDNKYLNLTGTMIGYQYSFFLNNANLPEAYYLYQITTPGLDEHLTPYISLTKISEKTKTEPYGKDSDILSMCLGSKKGVTPEAGKELLESILKKEGTVVKENGDKFPLATMVPGNNMQRAIIIGLRDALRWKNYKFVPGRYVDLLWTSKDFILLKICGDRDALWFEHVAAYRINDVNLENPLKVDWTRINYPKEKFTGTSKASDINRTLKRLEWGSFERRSFRRQGA